MYVLFSGFGFVAAFTWVAAARLIPARVRLWGALILFCTGAMLAWFLVRGVVRDISPYYGLFELGFTYAGGALGLAWVGASAPQGHTVRFSQWSGLIAALAFVAVSAGAGMRPQFGQLAFVHINGRRVPVRWVPARSLQQESSAFFAWAAPGEGDHVSRAAHASVVELERDVGSGPAPTKLIPVSNPGVYRHVEAQARAEMRKRLQEEAAMGAVPSFIAGWPLPPLNISGLALFRGSLTFFVPPRPNKSAAGDRGPGVLLPQE